MCSGLFFLAGAIIAGGGYVHANNVGDPDAVYGATLLLALFLSFLGYLTLIAGFSGMLYKVIADAVNRGQSINNPGASTTAHTPAGLPPVSTKPKTITKSARFDDFEF